MVLARLDYARTPDALTSSLASSPALKTPSSTGASRLRHFLTMFSTLWLSALREAVMIAWRSPALESSLASESALSLALAAWRSMRSSRGGRAACERQCVASGCRVSPRCRRPGWPPWPEAKLLQRAGQI